MYDSNANLTALLPVIPHVGSNLIIHIIIECTFRTIIPVKQIQVGIHTNKVQCDTKYLHSGH